MVSWSAHQLYLEAKSKIGTQQATNLRQYARVLQRKNLPVVFTLNHLAKITGISHTLLRDTVERGRERKNSRIYSIKKSSGGERFIHVINDDLAFVQKFINSEILQKLTPHPCSYAFHESGGVRECAEIHCGARWLFKFDLCDFFYHINERHVFEVFLNAGYRNLIAFEMARLCTTTRMPSNLHYLLKPNKSGIETQDKKYRFYNQHNEKLGLLPQGAPTSPMLSNLVAFKLDQKLETFAREHGLTYTRYADDITFSTSDDLPEKTSIGYIQRSVIKIISQCGFWNNTGKMHVAGPGSRKIVLGLLVDGEKARISKATFKRVDRLLHSIKVYGLDAVSVHEQFKSPVGLYEHLRGLLAFIKDVDTARWDEFKIQFHQVTSPWTDEPIVSGSL